jgi:hypothetical protein
MLYFVVISSRARNLSQSSDSWRILKGIPDALLPAPCSTRALFDFGDHFVTSYDLALGWSMNLVESFQRYWLGRKVLSSPMERRWGSVVISRSACSANPVAR